jgi:hypothetical protein
MFLTDEIYSRLNFAHLFCHPERSRGISNYSPEKIRDVSTCAGHDKSAASKAKAPRLLKIIVGFWRVECLTRQHETDYCSDFAGSGCGRNAGSPRIHALASSVSIIQSCG